MENLVNKISELRHSKREGDFWDFKRAPHENNASLLHDIICLSNSLHKGDRYLIIGISDPDEGCEIIGLTKGQKDRKNQANLIDFLRTKPFAGGLRPEIELITIKLEGQDIDIVVIKDNPFKPYYLTSDIKEQGKCIRSNYIYTRIVDTNTPIDKSADLYYIEKMWYERFGLDLKPSERFKQLLANPNDWFEDFGNVEYAYHKNFPEFRIEVTKPKKMWEPFCEFYPNNKGFYGTAYFKYQSGILFELTYIYCDEMRIMLGNPGTKHVRIDNENYWFYYYDLSSWNGLFMQFLRQKKMYFDSRGLGAPFLLFKNNDKVDEFAKYLEENKDLLNTTNPDYVPETRQKEYQSVISLEFLVKVKMIYDKIAYTQHFV